MLEEDDLDEEDDEDDEMVDILDGDDDDQEKVAKRDALKLAAKKVPALRKK